MKAVIFDFDGTIVDSLPALIHLYERIRGKRLRHMTKDIEQLRAKSMLQVALEMGVPKWRIVWLALFGRRMFKKHLRSISVYDGMQKLLSDLHDKGIKLYVVSTNRTSNVQSYLKWHHLDVYFDGIYGGANFLSKARTMHKVIKHGGFTQSDVWCVGDERVDIHSAHAAGLRIISVSWGYSSRVGLESSKPDRLVDDMQGLRKALRLP